MLTEYRRINSRFGQQTDINCNLCFRSINKTCLQ